jgi:hypothetical protein
MNMPEETPMSMPPTIQEVLARVKVQHPNDVNWTAAGFGAVQEALLERENQIVDLLHMAGSQFGLFPQIVAQVLSQVRLGTPKSEAERLLLHQQFVALMEQIARAQRGEGPMPTP